MINLFNSAKAQTCHSQITNNQKNKSGTDCKANFDASEIEVKETERLHCPVFISRCVSTMKLCRKRWIWYKYSPGLEARAGHEMRVFLKRG